MDENDVPNEVPVVEESALDQAVATAERLEKINKQLEATLQKIEAAKVESVLGGQSKAGDHPKVKSQDDLDQEAADALLSAAGFSSD